jgi:hypothetical protein
MLPTILALTLSPEILYPEILPESPKATESIVEQIVLDNFNTGEIDFKMPSENAQIISQKEEGLLGVLGGIRYTSLNSQQCNLDPLFCSDVRINKRGSGVLSVAHTELITRATVDLIYEVNIDDLREYKINFIMLSLDKTASENLKITVIANGIEYPVDNESLFFDFSSLQMESAVAIKQLTIRFSSIEADDFVLDEINLTRTYVIEPAPVPAFGFNPLPLLPLGALAFLGSSDGNPDTVPSVSNPVEDVIIVPDPDKNIDPVEVPENNNFLTSLLTGLVFLVVKFLRS